ncbi:hypothetical protein VP01_102g2 [Puccinia sorghi]|uniref:Uncharacterized protein n=1 Tax=Puccinia sorghi TaxID=27349 RepID=A0A0L6VUP7_9BASI|nr:hypothetical protein VP01_102g2 [Puccinia sorghi]
MIINFYFNQLNSKSSTSPSSTFSHPHQSNFTFFVIFLLYLFFLIIIPVHLQLLCCLSSLHIFTQFSSFFSHLFPFDLTCSSLDHSGFLSAINSQILLLLRQTIYPNLVPSTVEPSIVKPSTAGTFTVEPTTAGPSNVEPSLVTSSVAETSNAETSNAGPSDLEPSNVDSSNIESFNAEKGDGMKNDSHVIPEFLSCLAQYSTRFQITSPPRSESLQLMPRLLFSCHVFSSAMFLYISILMSSFITYSSPSTLLSFLFLFWIDSWHDDLCHQREITTTITLTDSRRPKDQLDWFFSTCFSEYCATIIHYTCLTEPGNPVGCPRSITLITKYIGRKIFLRHSNSSGIVSAMNHVNSTDLRLVEGVKGTKMSSQSQAVQPINTDSRQSCSLVPIIIFSSFIHFTQKSALPHF